MEYVQLGKSDLKVSMVILGAMSFATPTNSLGWSLPEAQALPILKHAFDMGINTWDTADIYSKGDSERIIGAALLKYNIPRQKVVLLSKCFGVLPEDNDCLYEAEMLKSMIVDEGWRVNRVRRFRKRVFDAVDASITRLGTYLDVLQIHRLDRSTPREEIMRALNDIVESGKVRYIGACTMAAWEFQSLQNIAKQNGWHQFISMQDYYSLIYREPEREMIPYCDDTDVRLIRGLPTRPHNLKAATYQRTDIYSDFQLGKMTSADNEIIGRVEELAKRKGVSMATIAIAWYLGKAVIPIVGLGSTERVDQAVESVVIAKAGLLKKTDTEFLEEKYVAKPVIVAL